MSDFVESQCAQAFGDPLVLPEDLFKDKSGVTVPITYIEHGIGQHHNTISKYLVSVYAKENLGEGHTACHQSSSLLRVDCFLALAQYYLAL